MIFAELTHCQQDKYCFSLLWWDYGLFRINQIATRQVLLIYCGGTMVFFE